MVVGDRSEAHSKLVNDILVELTKYRHIRVWKGVTGVAQSFDGKRTIKFGLPGSADITGLIGPRGIRVELEVKTGKGEQRDDQRVFQHMIERLGGIYAICRSVEDAKRAVSVGELI